MAVSTDAIPVTELLIPEGEFEAYLFDLDGTVADSMPLHFRAWNKIISEEGGHFPEELFYAWGGVPLHRIVHQLNERCGLEMIVEDVVRRKETMYLEMLHTVQPIASVVRVMEAQHGKVPFAIVSGSPHHSIESTLRHLGLRDRFELIVGAEDYTHGKPDPEPFLTAAKKLNVAPEKCLVFEDADAGIQAATAAGMKWVRVERPLPSTE
jgi:beta-phosphoglucomutase family hydrolase